MGAADTATPLAQAAAAEALRHWSLRTVLALLRAAVGREGAMAPLLDRHPVLRDWLDQAADAGLADLTLDEAIARLDARDDARHGPRDDAGVGADHPLQRLRAQLGLGADGLCVFVAAALAVEAPALAAFIDDLQGQQGQPTRATLSLAFGGAAAAAALQRLRAAGLLLDGGPGLAVPVPLWELACGLPPVGGPWVHRPRAALLPLEALVLPEALAARLASLSAPGTVKAPDHALWLLRGSAGSGRRTLAGALAHAAGHGLLVATTPGVPPALGAAATLLGALPLVSMEPAPGECLDWCPPPALPAPVFVRLPRHGGLRVDGPPPRRLDLDPPDPAERRRHWALAWPGTPVDDSLVAWRLPRGRLHRAAQAVPPTARGSAAARATVAGEIAALGRHALDGIARALPPAGADEPLALAGPASEEFEALVMRCRHRDRLAAQAPQAAAGAGGVRALFKGPSGTGKTLAARHLAARLGRPLHRVDLAATVSKYIGETERNLERVFDAAEALDIVLLLDEGDALLAGRTGVQNATDRYANLETNYLLQRLEAWTGVLVVTTNAADRIDPAFARRLDVTVEFALPDAATRLALWAAHLGPGHRVADEVLARIARRCAIPGGQIRNAALHAALLAIDRDRAIDEGLLVQALAREYRKAGQQCPSLQA